MVQRSPDFEPLALTSDDEFNALLGEMVLALQTKYPPDVAESMTREYYSKFTDPGYCAAIGVPVQDIDFFFHESANGMALRAHYYLGLGGDPIPKRFIEWRADQFRL